MKINSTVQACIVTALLLFGGVSKASAQATQVRIETAANGSGTVVPAQNLTAGNSITVYAISRTAGGTFVSNVAADSIRIVNETGQVNDTNLVVAGNRRSAVLTGRGTGTLQIRAYSGSLTPMNSGIITVVSAAANRLRIATEPSDTATAGVAFSRQPVIRIEDSFGNLVTSDSTTVITAARLSGSGTLQGTLSKTANGGIATFTNLSHTVATTISLRFTSSPSLAPDTSTNILVNPAAASKLLYVQQPTNAIAGGTISPAITIRLRDQFDNNVLTNGVSISLALTTGTGVLSGTSTQPTNASGISTFGNLSINLSGSKQLTASGTGLTSLLSSTFMISAGPARQLGIQTQPSGIATAGVAFAQQPVVRILDSLGNLVTTDNSTIVTATRLLGTGTLQGTTTATASGGIATFLNLSHRVADTINIRFTTTAPVLTPDTSNDIFVNPAAASKLVFGQQPTNTSAGATITPPLTAQLQDSFNNPVSTSGIAVALALTSGTGTLSGTKNRTTDSTGRATFNDLSINLVGTKVLTATSTGLTSAVSNSFTITGGVPASIVTTAGTPQSATVNATFGTNLQATVRDGGGNPVSGAVVTFTQPVSGAGGNFAGGVNTATTNASGVATAATFTANATAGSYTVAATVSGVATPANFLLTNNPGPAATIAATGGTPQSTQVGVAFGTRLQATVRDSFSNPIQGVIVTFTKPDTGASGTFAGGINTATTDSAGRATAPTFTANTKAGTYAVSATAPGVASPANFSLTNTAGSAASITSTAGTPQSTQVGTTFSVLLQATVKDAANNPVNGATVTFTAPSSGASGTFANNLPTTTATTNASGIATATTFRANLTAASYSVNATVSGVATSAVFTLTNTPGPPTTIVTTAGTPQSARVNTAFSTNFQVSVKDTGNNPLSGVTVTFIAPSTGTRGTFPGGLSTASATTNVSGLATAPLFTAGTSIGSNAVNASVVGIAVPATFSVSNTSGPPDSIASIAGTPQSTQVNTAFLTNLQVVVLDAFNNPAQGVTVTFTAPLTGASGTFAAGVNTAVTNASGIATAQPFTANGTSGEYIVGATVSGVATPANFSLTNTPGSPASITPSAGTPQSVQVGGAFAVDLQATVRDSSGNPVNGALVTFTGPTTGARGTFASGSNTTTATTNATGVATASVFTANTVSGSYTVSGTVSGVVTPANYALTNSPGPATSVVATAGTPQSTQISTAFPVNFQVVVRDTFGNPIANRLVTFTPPPSGATGSFAGSNTATTNSSGVATANVFVANIVAGSYTVNATVSGVLTPAAFNLTNTPGTPASVTATAGTPQSAQVGTAFTTNLQTTVRDGANNPIPDVVVTFTAPSTGPSGTFVGNLSTINVNTNSSGVATATIFTANTTAGSYTVTATVSGVATPANFSLTNSTGPPGSITVTAGNPQSATVNTAFPVNLQVIVKDAANNPVAGATVTFNRPGSGASGTFAGNNNQAVTNGSGIATAQVFTANTIAGSYEIMASAPGVATPAIFNLTNNPGTASIITAVAGTPQSAQVGTAFAANLKAKVTDAFNNPVRNVLVTFNLPSSGPSGTFASGVNTATTDSTGTATANQLTANLLAGAYNISAAASGIGTPAQFALTNTSGSAATIAAASGTPQNTRVNTIFATNLSASVRDAQNNPVVGAVVTFTMPLTGASGRFPGDSTSVSRTTDANGIATAPNLTANSIAGNFTATATVSGVPAPANFNLTNNPGLASIIAPVAGTPQSTQINSVFAIRLQARVRDAAGNAIPNATVTFTAPSSGASGTFQGGGISFQGQTDSNGIATAATFTANAAAGAYTVTGTVAGVATPAQFELTNTSAAAASITITQGASQNTQVGTAFATALQVVVRDASNNPVPGALVTFTAPSTGASGAFTNGLNSFSVNTNAAGLATATTFTANNSAGSYSVSAAVSGVATPAQFALTNNPGAAAVVLSSAGTPQSTTVNTGFATNLQATVRDGLGNPISGITVTFTAPSSGASGIFAGGSGTFSGQTNASGVLTAPQFKANTTAGSYSVTASVSGVPTPATYALTNTPGIAASVLITAGASQSTVVGTQFPTPIQITVRDSFSNPIPNVSVALGSPSSGASCTFNPNPTTTNSNGVAQTVATAGTISGSYIGTATVSGITPSSISLRNLPAVQKRIITVAGTPQSAQVGTAFSTALQTTVRDTFDNPIPNLTVTYTAPQTGANGTFSGGVSTAQVQTDSNGRASAPTFTANTTPGTFNVNATVSGIATPAVFVLTNLTGPPGNISATQGTPQSAVVRTPFAARFKAVVRDAANNPLPGVVVSFSRPVSGASGTFVGDSTAITDANGLAEANIFTANTVAGNYNILASAPGVSSPALYNLTNLPGSAHTVLASAGTPQAAQIGIPFSIPLRATVKDTFGNLVAAVTVRFVRPASGASCNFAGNIDTARTEANGVATSPTFVANLIAGSYTVSGTVAGVSSTANFELTNTAAQPGGITITAGNGQTAQINTPFAVRLAAMVRDAANNPVPGVEVTFTPPPTGPGGTFRSGNNRAMTNSGGVATADSFFANAIAGSYEVVATAPGVSQPARFNLTNIPSAAANISALGGTPQAAQVNTAFATRFRVGVRDGANNPVSNALVTFTKPGSGASGTFQGNVNTSTTNDSGFALAQPFTANGIAGSYIVSATVQGVTVPAEFQLVNTTGVPGTISVFAGGTQQTIVNTAFDTTLSVRLVDASGNPVNNIEVIFTAPSSGSSGTFANGTRTVSVMTNTAGQATASTFTANSVAGPYEVMATALGVATPAIFTLSNKPDAVNTFVLEGESGGTIGTQLVGVPFNIRMFARDRFNNTVVNFNGPVVMGSTGVLSIGNGTTSVFSNGTLVHRMAFKKTGSNVTLTAVRSGGTELGTSNTFSVNNPAPALAGINPSTGSLLETLTLTVRGTNFIDSTTTLNLGSGISLNSVTVDSASQLRATITIAANATVGQRNITVTNPAPGGGTSIGLPFIVDMPVPPPPALAGPPNASGNQRTTLLLVWSKSALSLSYHLQVSTSLSFATTVFDDSTLTDTVKTLGPPIIQNGTTYYWRVRGRNARGAGAFAQIKSFATIPAYPASFTLSTTVSYAQRPNAGDYSATEYRIVGMPGASNARVSSILEGTQNLDWVAYWDNGAPSNNFVPFDGSLNFNFSTGRAFWILRKGPLNISSTVPTAPLDTTTNSVDIPLHSGWNLITNPFATTIPWSEVQTANSSTLSPIYKFEGSFAISSSLEPYKGYYYFKDASSPQNALKIPFGLFTSALAKTSVATTGWRASIELIAGGYNDNTSSFGIDAGAREGLDSLEYRKPRSFGDIPSVQFMRPEWDNNFSSFATDFRPAVGDLQTWKFNVHSISRELMELRFDEIERIPSEYKAYLIDERQAKFIDLRDEARYKFSSPFPSSEFSIIVGQAGKVQEVLNSVGPKEFSLGNNFPNPFNPTTTIPIALPQTADVIVKVYNVLGEEVRTIFSGALNAGRYYLVWDGKDKSGNTVASGIYLSRFTTNTGKAFTGKMILMK